MACTLGIEDIMYVFTDGSARNDLGAGSYGYVITDGSDWMDYEVEFLEGINSAEAEVRAILKALEYIDIYTQKNTTYYIVSDCQYCIRAINEWLPTWMEEKRDIKFFDIWKKISILAYRKNIYYFWINSHSGIDHNDMIDEICKETLKTAQKDDVIHSNRNHNISD